MTSVELRATRAQILSVLHDYHAAMAAGSVEQLEELLEADFSLVHMTGYVQPRHEWLDAIRSGEFDYRRIHVDQTTLTIEVDGMTATLTGGGVFEASIYGTSRPWEMDFTLDLAKRDDQWRITRASYVSAD